MYRVFVFPFLKREKSQDSGDGSDNFVCPSVLEKRVVAAVVKDDEHPHEKTGREDGYWQGYPNRGG